MKYMIMMFGGAGGAIRDRSPEWIARMQQLMMDMDKELRDSGELVDSQKLTDPAAAKTVWFVESRAVPTDGPFAEVEESLAGYWVVEATEERALEIAARVGVHRVPDGGATADGLVAECLTPANQSRTCCANSRRRSSAHWHGSTAI